MDRYQGRYRIPSARHPRWDYAAPGWYFVTWCTQGRVPWLGTVERGSLRLSAAGRIVADEWRRTPVVRPRVTVEAWAVMPDHVHALIGLDVEGPPPDVAPVGLVGQPPDVRWRSGSVGAIVGQIKSVSTKRIRRAGMPDFAWQPRFHDRIVRSRRAFVNIRRYIIANPSRWVARRRP
ncbi:MAG: transposase [Bacteroidota bacterium]